MTTADSRIRVVAGAGSPYAYQLFDVRFVDLSSVRILRATSVPGVVLPLNVLDLTTFFCSQAPRDEQEWKKGSSVYSNNRGHTRPIFGMVTESADVLAFFNCAATLRARVRNTSGGVGI